MRTDFRKKMQDSEMHDETMLIMGCGGGFF